MLVHVQAEPFEFGYEDAPVIHVIEPGMRPVFNLSATDRTTQTGENVGLHMRFVVIVETDGPGTGDAVAKPGAEEIRAERQAGVRILDGIGKTDAPAFAVRFRILRYLTCSEDRFDGVRPYAAGHDVGFAFVGDGVQQFRLVAQAIRPDQIMPFRAVLGHTRGQPVVDGDMASVGSHATPDHGRFVTQTIHEPDGLFASLPASFVGHGLAHDGIRYGPQMVVRAFQNLTIGQGQTVDGQLLHVAEVLDGEDPPVAPVHRIAFFEVPVPSPAGGEAFGDGHGDTRIQGKSLAAT